MLFAGLCVVAVFFAWNYVFSGQFKQIGEAKNEIKIEKLNLAAALDKERQLMAIQSKTMGKIAKKDQEQNAIEVINYITENTSRIGLGLISIKPDYQAVQVKEANAMRFDLILEGNYNDIYRFMEVLEKSPNLLVVELFNLSHKSGSIVTASIGFSSYY